MFEFGRNDIEFPDAYEPILEQTENDIAYYKEYFLSGIASAI